MPNWTVRNALSALGALTGVVYVLIGVVVGALPAVWEDTSTGSRVFWVAFVVGAGALLLIGLRIFDRLPRAGAVLICAGAVVGGLVLAWSIAAPVAAIALVVLSVVCARRVPTQTLA